jgi:sugar phosphate isomerase/epimerase
MRFGICASFRDVAAFKNVTFDYLEEHVQRFLVPEQPQEAFEELWREARRLPIPIEAANSLLPSDLALVATPTQQVDIQRLQRYMRTALRRAEQVGIHVIVFGSGAARACPAGYDKEDAIRQIGEHLTQWSEWAGEHGVQLVLEPLRYEETNTLNTAAEAGILVHSLKASGARLLIDTYHMACNQEAPTTILPYASLLEHVHVAEKRERAAPGRYGEDQRPYFSVLHLGGYDKRISIECNWQDLAAEAESGVAVLRDQWTSVAR